MSSEEKSVETQSTVISACKSSFCANWSETTASNCKLADISFRRYGICGSYRPNPFKKIRDKLPSLSGQEEEKK